MAPAPAQGPASAPNPNPKPKSSYHIGGIQVEFPYQPYGPQLAFMSRVISTLERAHRDGHCHALLESPTGTGKSLSLLCSTLAWQHHYKLKNRSAIPAHSKPHPEALTDPLAHGGGFVPETTQPSRNLPSWSREPTPQAAENNKTQKKKAVPTIYYASRTHSQISQVIREYRKTAYRVPMAVLASRKHYCTNSHVNGKENIDEECKLLLRNRDAGDVGCLQFKNVHKVRGHISLQKGGCHEVHDIEDLVKVGKSVKGCPYYAARSMADDAQLVFCPYSYIINPVIRGAMEVDIKGAILVLDEAHNLEDNARDAGSVDVEENVLHKLQVELGQMCAVDSMIYQPLLEMTQDLISWIERRKDTLEKREFQNYFSCWTGDKALKELQEANISQQCFPIMLECALKAIKAATDPESEVAHLSGMSVIVLEGLFSSLNYFFSRNGSHVSDYQLALQRRVKRDRKNSDWTTTLSLWCLNPAVVFKDISDLSLSVILTSGTLSPMHSFSSELGVQFGTCLEAPHVVDVESQVWTAVVPTSPDNYPLNASYKSADGFAFQDALGKSLEEICNVVPGGSLIFFPSYKLMEKLCSRWRETGQWFRLNARKSLFVEPRGGSQEDFDSLLKGYYDSIHQRNTPSVARKRRVKKVGLHNFKTTEPIDGSKKEGAALLAVCRGKVSEGLDFADNNARVVIVVGIPFPNIHDNQVGLKKKFNDTYKTTKNLLSGNEWYCHQAFRALNQAIGRCIRHRFDYGAIILLDERYQEERNRIYISKWLRKSIRQYDNFEMSIQGLKTFFSDAKNNDQKNVVDPLLSSDASVEKDDSPDNQSKSSKRNRCQKLNKYDECQELVSLTKSDVTSPNIQIQCDAQVLAPILIEEDCESCREIVGQDTDCHSDSRFCEASTREDPEITFVKETPGKGGSGTIASPVSFSKAGNNSTMTQVSTEFADHLPFQSVFSSELTEGPNRIQCSMAISPEKEFTSNGCSLRPELESSLNLSVNSHTQKRRKSMCSPLIHLDEELSDSPNAQTLGCIRSTRNCTVGGDTNRKIEFGFEGKYAECQSTSSTTPQLLFVHNCPMTSASCTPVMDKKLQISCSLCKSPLGRPENHLYVQCSLTSSSKVHLVSLSKGRLEHSPENTSTCVPVLMADILSVDQHLCNGTPEKPPGKGVWSEEDGCVFRSIFCPFCDSSNCLGVQIMATDASNVQLLNKILFYLDRLEIGKVPLPKETDKRDEDLLLVKSSRVDRSPVLNSIESFSYSPQQNSGGWRTTKSKLRLPKRVSTGNGRG